MAKISDVQNTSLLFAEGSAPSTPASGFGRIYVKTTGLFFIGDDGVEIGPLAAASGGSAPASARFVRSTGDYTTTSTSWVDVDGTNFSLAITTGARRVMVGFVGSVFSNSNAGAVGLTVSVDGTDQGAVAPFGLQYYHQHATANEFMPASFVYLTDVLSAASHTFKLRWAVNASTATMGGSTPTSEFWVAELA